MKKLFSFTILAMLLSFASYALSPISGPSTGCVGSLYYLSDADSSSTSYWTSSDSTIASINASGELVAEAVGTVTITFYSGGSTVTSSFTVTGPSAPVTQSITSFCVGTSSIASDATTGGTWSSYEDYIATVSATGVVTGVSSGIAVIAYTSPAGCVTYVEDTINATDAGYLYATGSICIGGTGTLIDSFAVAGGTWSSADPSIATISSSGVITGIAAGTATISYTVPTGTCGSGSATTSVVISGTTDAGSIYGATTLYAGTTTSLSDYIGTGTWSTADPSIATINPVTGMLTGIAAGTTTATYSVMGCGGLGTTSAEINVTTFNGISGTINFGSTPYYGVVTVWLIKYNPATLELTSADSTSYYCSGTSVSYEFDGVTTDSFRIKASVSSDSSYATTGYVPTYHTSSFYWSDATVLYHTAGTGDINQDINMAYGSATSGPGFIGGSVTTGANKGTSGTIPAVGLLVYAVNASSGTLIQQTYTDASGNYSFTGLPTGTYEIYPEAINYNTTAYTSITITTTTPSMTAASFIEHTLSKTITPIEESVSTVAAAISSITTYPNPAGNTLHILWNTKATETGTIVIADITGREVYKTDISMASGNGASQIDMSAFANGLYILTVKSATIDYTGKVQVQH